MEGILQNPVVVICMTAALAIVATYVVDAVAHRLGFVAKPKADRWHRRPTAMLGGVAIFISTIAGYVLFDPKTPESLTVIGGSVFLFFVGLIDDIVNIKPYQKLIGQLLGRRLLFTWGSFSPLLDTSFLIFGSQCFGS